MSQISVFFYGLFDPRTDVIRYVGQTIDPDARYGQHGSIRLRPWLDELAEVGLAPEMRLLTRMEIESTELTRGGVAAGRAELVEKALIESFQNAGADLLNSVGLTIGYQHTRNRVRTAPKGDHPSPVAGQRAQRTNRYGNGGGQCARSKCRGQLRHEHVINVQYPSRKFDYWYYCSQSCRDADFGLGLHHDQVAG